VAVIGMRVLVASMMSISLLLAGGCSQDKVAVESTGQMPEETQTEPAASEVLSPPIASIPPADGDEEPPPLPERLRSELEQRQEGEEEFAEWLQAWAENQNRSEHPIRVFRADLDRDGLEREWASVLYEYRILPEGVYPVAYGVVVTLREGKYGLQSFEFPLENYGWDILAIEDLSGDGKPEIVWASLSSGAHTASHTYRVSGWEDGLWQLMQGTAIVPSVTDAKVRNGKLMVTGGLIYSVGAGPWQREYTDTYSIVEGTLKRDKRVFPSSPTPYHRLLDGMWAEAAGDFAEALKHYNAAASMKSADYKDYTFTWNAGWPEEETMGNEEEMFDSISRKFARLREELLKATLRGTAGEQACVAAKKKSGYEASWLTSLNAPYGYANPAWSEPTICSGIEELIRD